MSHDNSVSGGSPRASKAARHSLSHDAASTSAKSSAGASAAEAITLDDEDEDQTMQQKEGRTDTKQVQRVGKHELGGGLDVAAAASRAESVSPAIAAPTASPRASAPIAPHSPSSSTIPASPFPASTPASSLLSRYFLPTRRQWDSSSFDYVDEATEDGQASSAIPSSSLTAFLRCPLCNKPFYQPVQHQTCTQVYCKGCLEKGATRNETAAKQGRQQKEPTAAAAATDSANATQPSTSSSSTVPTCIDCHLPILVGSDTTSPSKPLLLMLDGLRVRCTDCSQILPRSRMEEHWLMGCEMECAFVKEGCEVKMPRSQMNAHIESCSFAPVPCQAETYGCTWHESRDALTQHSNTCNYVAMLPAFEHQERQHSKAMEELRADYSRKLRHVQIQLSAREAQLRSYTDRMTKTGWWEVGTIIDCLDTENSWLPAKILKVDAARRLYRIHYIDWDSSWDESINWFSPRLAPAATHTDKSVNLIAKHANHVIEGTMAGCMDPNACAARSNNGGSQLTHSPSSNNSPLHSSTASRINSKSGNKRKVTH